MFIQKIGNRNTKVMDNKAIKIHQQLLFKTTKTNQLYFINYLDYLNDQEDNLLKH